MEKKRAGFAQLDRAMLDSPAFRSLSKTAMLVLLDFLSMCIYENKNVGKHRVRVCINKENLAYSYEMAEKKGIPKSSFARTIGELIEKGFLSIKEQGIGLFRSANRYALDGRWQDWNTARFVRVEKPPPRMKKGFKRGHDFHHKIFKSGTENGTGSSTKNGTG